MERALAAEVSATTATGCAYVVSSEVTVAADSSEVLELAFLDRLRLVERAGGFQRLEVWHDVSQPGVFLMVSWWDDEASFRRYMRSPDHRASHQRIPGEPDKPRGTGVRRWVQLPGA